MKRTFSFLDTKGFENNANTLFGIFNVEDW